MPIGAVFALPALRTRGVTLAVITLGLGVAVNSLLFNNVNYTGGYGGTNVGVTHLFGLDIDSFNHPRRWAITTLVGLLLVALAVANVRRSATGRRLIAIRENERAAASLGLSVLQSKLFAFMVASGIAALGGILIAFQSQYIVYGSSFGPLDSILAVAYAVIGGLGYLLGPLLGSVIAPGGVASLLQTVLSSLDNYLALIGGIAVVLTLMLNPDGIVSGTRDGFAPLLARLRRSRAKSPPATAPAAGRAPAATITPEPRAADVEPGRVAQRRLEVRGLTVRFGAVVAVNDVNLDVAPGEVVGLIGPNGAGKTTLIDAVTGFVRAPGAQVNLGSQSLSRRSAGQRSRAGLVRSWQSLELFDDITVAENLQIASESATRSWRDDARSLVWPAKRRLTDAALAAIEEFGLHDDLGRRPSDLSYGRRRLVGIARAVALAPSVLLLDEPAAGLSSTESAELGHLVSRLAATWGMGILLIEHDVDLIMQVSHRVVVMDFGRVIAQGPPDQVRKDELVTAAYLGQTEDVPVLDSAGEASHL